MIKIYNILKNLSKFIFLYTNIDYDDVYKNIIYIV